MVERIERKELKKIADAYYGGNKDIVRSCASGVRKRFVEYLALQETRSREEGRFALRGAPVRTPYSPPRGTEMYKQTLISRFLRARAGHREALAVIVAVSYRCSRQCGQCYISEYVDPSKKEMTVGGFRTAFHKIVEGSDTWHFDITGGEPFEHPRFFEIIRQIPPGRATAVVATNGALLDKHLVSRIRSSNIMACKVSLDLCAGLDSSRVKRSLAGITMLIENRILAFAQIYLQRGLPAFRDFREVIERCRKAGAANIHLIRPMAVGNLRGREDLFLTGDEIANVKYWIDYYQFKHRYQITVFPDWEFIKFGGCLAGRGRIYISPYGDVYPCNFFPRSYGNIVTDDFKRIVARMRRDIGDNPDHCRAAGIIRDKP